MRLLRMTPSCLAPSGRDHIVTPDVPGAGNIPAHHVVCMHVRRLLLLTAAACLVLAGCASGVHHARSDAGGSASTLATQVSTTATYTFRPFHADGTPAAPISRHTSGHCWEISLAAPAAASYRCLAANTILDPCFAPTSTARPITLACYASPWSKAVALTVHRKLPKGSAAATRPWAVTLAGGTRCVAGTGTAPFVSGVGLGYRCTDGTAAALRGAGAHIRALVGRSGGHSLHRVVVTDLWRG
jgi:hypothetical protein